MATAGGVLGYQFLGQQNPESTVETEEAAGSVVSAAAAGAFIGRKIQEEVQDNRADRRTTTTIERRCGSPGSDLR